MGRRSPDYRPVLKVFYYSDDSINFHCYTLDKKGRIPMYIKKSFKSKLIPRVILDSKFFPQNIEIIEPEVPQTTCSHIDHSELLEFENIEPNSILFHEQLFFPPENSTI